MGAHPRNQSQTAHTNGFVAEFRFYLFLFFNMNALDLSGPPHRLIGGENTDTFCPLHHLSKLQHAFRTARVSWRWGWVVKPRLKSPFLCEVDETQAAFPPASLCLSPLPAIVLYCYSLCSISPSYTESCKVTEKTTHQQSWCKANSNNNNVQLEHCVKM